MAIRAIYAVVVLLALNTCRLHAQLTVLTVAAYKAAFAEGSTPAKKANTENYILGVANGINWTNGSLKREGRPLYCQPPQLDLNPTNYKEMLDRAIKKLDPKALPKGINSIDGWPIEPLLLQELINVFPCGGDQSPTKK